MQQLLVVHVALCTSAPPDCILNVLFVKTFWSVTLFDRLPSLGKGWGSFLLFCGCIHFSPLFLSLLLCLPRPPSAQHSQFIQTRQVAQSHWEWSPGSSQTATFQPQVRSEPGASTASRGTLTLPVWTSTGRPTLGLPCATTAPSGSRWG